MIHSDVLYCVYVCVCVSRYADTSESPQRTLVILYTRKTLKEKERKKDSENAQSRIFFIRGLSKERWIVDGNSDINLRKNCQP